MARPPVRLPDAVAGRLRGVATLLMTIVVSFASGIAPAAGQAASRGAAEAKASAAPPTADPVAIAARAVAVPDTLEARLRACVGCHGDQGRATRDGYYPRIAGKPAGYLENQLRHFRDGRRVVPAMTWMLDGLPDAYLRDMAEHFAALHPPYPPPPPPAVSAAELERGRRLATVGDPDRDLPACAACHGEALLGVRPAVPGLLGLPRDYLNAQFGAWRAGTRQAFAPDCMATIARRMAVADIAAVTAWLATRPVPPEGRPAVTGPARWPLECGGVGR